MITKEQKEYCIHNLTAMVLNKLCSENQDLSYAEAASHFMGSSTYAMLANTQTYLWAEGPDFIMEMFQEELQS